MIDHQGIEGRPNLGSGQVQPGPSQIGLCAGNGGLGLLQLLAMRAETGAFYPPYSTFRADPLGTRAFYESSGYRLEAVLKDFYAVGDGKAIYCNVLT